MSSESSALLRENPRGETESWEAWGERLAQKYPSPAVTPNLPLVPGHDSLRASHRSRRCLILPVLTQFSFTAETWIEYGAHWKEHYDSKIAGRPIQTSGPTLPPLPNSDATGSEWAAWGNAVGQAWTDYAKSKGIDLIKILEGLKTPEEPAEDDSDGWTAYAAQWGQYGKQVQERFTAALAAKAA